MDLTLEFKKPGGVHTVTRTCASTRRWTLSGRRARILLPILKSKRTES